MKDSANLTPGEEAFNKICEELKREGINVVAVLSMYEKGEAYFHTTIHMNENKELGLTEDHMVMDVIREISSTWSEKAHK